MRRIILLMTVAALVVVSTLFFVSASGAHKHPTAMAQKQTTKTVLIQGFRFKPAQITIKRGTKVRWINKDSHPHTATAINGKSFDSGHLGKGQRYTHTFKTELVHRRRLPDREVARNAIFEYLEGFYNRRRLHSALSYRSLADYEEATMEGVAVA